MLVIVAVLLALAAFGTVKFVKWLVRPSRIFFRKHGDKYNVYVTAGKLKEKDKRKIRDL